MANETQPVVKQTAGLFGLNVRDLALGAIVSVGSAVVTVIYDAIQQGGFEAINWKVVLQVAVSAFIAYLGKNFLTPQKTIVIAKNEDVRVTTSASGKTVVTADAPIANTTEPGGK